MAGVEALPQLETLLAANNLFPDASALEPLRACTALRTLDLRDCKITSADGLLDVLQVHTPSPLFPPLPPARECPVVPVTMGQDQNLEC